MKDVHGVPTGNGVIKDDETIYDPLLQVQQIAQMTYARYLDRVPTTERRARANSTCMNTLLTTNGWMISGGVLEKIWTTQIRPSNDLTRLVIEATAGWLAHVTRIGLDLPWVARVLSERYVFLSLEKTSIDKEISETADPPDTLYDYYLENAWWVFLSVLQMSSTPNTMLEAIREMEEEEKDQTKGMHSHRIN